MGLNLRVGTMHLTSIVVVAIILAIVFMVPVGRAQPLTPKGPDSVRALLREFCQICLFLSLLSLLSHLNLFFTLIICNSLNFFSLPFSFILRFLPSF